jgi:ABC-type glycerol-3-phosphate transport system permease component
MVTRLEETRQKQRFEQPGQRAERVALQLGKYLFLILIALVCLLPFIWVWSTAFRTTQEFIRDPLGMPSSLQFQNLIDAWKTGHFNVYWKNSIIISLPTTIGVVTLCTLAGYAFARLEFFGRTFLFFIFLIGLMIPFESIMIPLYYQLRDMRILATYWAAILPMTAFGLPFGIFMMRAFFQAIPSELSDAARVDGCTELGVFLRVILPLARPAAVSLAVFQFMWAWNALLIPLVYVQREQYRPLTVGLLMFQNQYVIDYGKTAAAVTITSLPIILIFILFQREFIQGLTAGALRG